MNEPKNEDFENEYREFDAEDPDCQQEFAEDADGGKSNRSPLMHIDPQPVEAVLNIACTIYVRSIFAA